MPIVNNFRPAPTVYVKITSPCHVGGKAVAVNDVVEVTGDDAGLITASHRGRIVPKPEPKAEEPKKQPAK